jgi:hypothetical protein
MPVETERRSSMNSQPKGPVSDRVASAVSSSVHVPEGLDWQGFSAAYFPGRRRHDLEALTAYSAYKRSRDTVTGSSAESAGIETWRGATGAIALRNWEDDWGATLSPDGP